jgi:hypothetical protein
MGIEVPDATDPIVDVSCIKRYCNSVHQEGDEKEKGGEDVNQVLGRDMSYYCRS